MKKVAVMPIVALFNKKGFHALATNPEAQAFLNEAMVRESKLYGYVGAFNLILKTSRGQIATRRANGVG